MGQPLGDLCPRGPSLREWLQSYKWDLFRYDMEMFVGSLIATVFIMPFVAALVTAMLYLAFPHLSEVLLLPISLSVDSKVEYPLINGAIITFLLWLIAALFCSIFTTAWNADMHSYGKLRANLSRVEAHLGLVEDRCGDLILAAPNLEDCLLAKTEYQKLAKHKVTVDCACIAKYLWRHRAGISWVLGSDYVNVWEMCHRAEEALIIIMPRDELIGVVQHDRLALENASICNREELCVSLSQVLAALNPNAATLLVKSQLDENRRAIDAIRDTINRELTKGSPPANLPPSSTASNDNSSTAPPSAPKLDEATARVIARQVRGALNEYRAHLWEKLLETRNQLLITIALTGIATYMLLFIAIVVNPLTPPNPAILPDPAILHNPILAAGAFYIAGALTGLCARLYKETQSHNSLVDDYSLSYVRLVAVPLLSGLAGIGGVLIMAPLVEGVSTSLGAIFDITASATILRSLLIAAAFGLAPNRLIQDLQKKAEKYASDLEKSEAEGPKISDTKV